jgi:hypothetical protein
MEPAFNTFKNLINCYIIPIYKPDTYSWDSGDLHFVKKSQQSETIILKNLKTGRNRYLHYEQRLFCKIITEKSHPEYFI